MAYARRRFGSYRAKRQTRRRGTGYKRSSGRTRRYRTTKKTSRRMSKRTVLNATSRKKRNGMLSWSNTAQTGASQTVGVGPAYVNGVGSGFFLWLATANDLTNGGGGVNTVSQEAARTSTTCYMRGLSEKLRIQTNSGLPWFWRRICFTFRGPFYPATDSPTQSPRFFQDTSNGIVRLWFNTDVNNTPNLRNQIDGLIFKGAKGVDWNDVIVAPTDTRRITVKYDKTRILRSGNANGTVKECNMWHPMNKNLVYDDDESGDQEAASYQSVDSKAGMGDYYVLDLISAGTGGSTSDGLLIQANSTLYWHEK